MQTFFDITGLNPTMTLAFPVGLIIAWIAIGLFWNKKVRPFRMSRSNPTATFNNILGRTLRFMYKEDKNPLIPAPKGTKKEIPDWRKTFNKWVTWHRTNLALTLAATALTLYGNPNALWLWAALLIASGTRTSTIFQKRHAMFYRMFKVAAHELKYPRGSDMNPWGHVTVKEWTNLTQPGETIVRFPAEYDTSDPKRRDNFERHFNSTVTSENQWVYEWDGAQGTIICKPVENLPTFAKYPGALPEWNKISLGPNADGVAVWDVTKSPHSLVTGTTGGGKATRLSSPVLTSEGMKIVGDLKVGDTVFDPEGKPTRVDHLHPIVTPRKAYEFTFANGEKLVTDPEHLWETETRAERLSRYNLVTRGRKRDFWLDDTVVEKVKAEIGTSSSKDVISIPQVADLIGKCGETKTLFQIAKEVGIAEVHRPRVKFHYNAQVVSQRQKVTEVDAEEFIAVYNNRRIILSKGFPISKDQQVKLSELVDELRDTDTMTVENIIEYLDAVKVTAQWVRDNFDTSLPLKDAIKDLAVKAEPVAYPYPAKIFSYSEKTMDGRQFATLMNLDYSREIGMYFSRLSKDLPSRRTVEKVVELIVPEKVVERPGNPVNMYPKQMFLEHILVHNETPLNDQRHKRITTQIRTTQEIVDTFYADKKGVYKNHSIRKTKALNLPEQSLSLHPYALGAWLGDGSSRDGAICGIDHEVFEHITELGYPVVSSTREGESKHKDFRVVRFSGFHGELRKLGLLLNVRKGESVKANGSPKRIPVEYLMSSIEQRRELLRGLLDTDGTVKDTGGVQFTTVIPELKDGFVQLVSSLGYIPFVNEKDGSYRDKAGVKIPCKRVYTITFQADPADRLFHLSRKNAVHAERFRGNEKEHGVSDAHYIVGVREVEPVPMRCVSVDSPSRLFLVGDTLIPTHNSTIQRNIIFHCIQHKDKWAFLGIDVKRVELKPYAKYSDVVMGIATDVPDGVEIMRYGRDEMMDRYTMMEELGVNNFQDLPNPPKALMIMIDESYMFLAPSGIKTDEGKEEDALKGEASKIIGDIARLGRAAGVHLLMATQRPDATVIYGELKQNLSMRVAAGRMDSIASSMTLDNEKATLLPGNIKGRGYAQENGLGGPFQGYFAPQSWIDDWLAGKDMTEEESAPSKGKKPKKSRSKKGKEGKAFEESGSVKGKKKGGLLAKMQAFNEAQFDETDGDADPVDGLGTFVDDDVAEDPKPKRSKRDSKRTGSQAVEAPVLDLGKDDDDVDVAAPEAREADAGDLFSDDLGLESDHDAMRDVSASFSEVEYEDLDDEDDEGFAPAPAKAPALPEEGLSLFDGDDEDDLFANAPTGDGGSTSLPLFDPSELDFLDDDPLFNGGAAPIQDTPKAAPKKAAPKPAPKDAGTPKPGPKDAGTPKIPSGGNVPPKMRR